MDTQTHIQYVKGIGPRRSAQFQRLGVETVEDACFYLPRRYEDRRALKKIVALQPGQLVTIIGEVQMAGVTTTARQKKKMYEVTVSDSSGIVTAKWFHFNAKYMKDVFQKGRKVVLSGQLQTNQYAGWGKELIHPEHEILSGDQEDLIHCGRIVPIYPATEGLSQRMIRGTMKLLIDEFSSQFADVLPPAITDKYKLIPLAQAINNVHFPDKPYDNLDQLNQNASPPHKRLIFEELFLLQVGLALKKQGRHYEEKGVTFNPDGALLGKLQSILPFPLTGAQKRVIGEIKTDMSSPHPMQRLLQGDVGSGKTVIALAAALIAIENGYQAAIMAPTEILAEQHQLKLHHLLEQLELRAALLTGEMPAKLKRAAAEQIESGQAQLIIGTHALIQTEVKFARLGLVIVDEQHKFGVAQRLTLQKKGGQGENIHPDLLVMTATPIPRSLALTVYGDLSLSVLDEMPPGRQPVRTHLRYDKDREKIYQFLRGEVGKGGQVYIVYPLVEESEKLELKAATKMYEHFQKDVFPELNLGLVHGRMSANDKEQVMQAFRRNEISILIATTVIEVGIDVPNTSIMLIEHAERFGLSQLHQLRGRIGRGERPSHCILLAQFPMSVDARQRLQVMVNCSDGFTIAEEDLRLRGPGDFWGTRQSGLPDLRVSQILRDAPLLEIARKEAFSLVASDPHLENHKPLLSAIEHKWKEKLDLLRAG